jgi:hypothetical protein
MEDSLINESANDYYSILARRRKLTLDAPKDRVSVIEG